MQVSLEISEDLGRRIAADPGELPRAALEGLALEAIRSGKLTASQARRLLGIPSRYEMDGFLKAHGVFLNLTLDDVRRDSEVARADLAAAVVFAIFAAAVSFVLLASRVMYRRERRRGQRETDRPD